MMGSLTLTRRSAIAAIAGATLETSVASAGVAPLQRRMLSGRVYRADSAFGNDRQHRRGIAGVLVSNGVDIVATGATGMWQLPDRGGSHVFIVKPTGWALPSRANGLPDFFRPIDRSEGLDFTLIEKPEPSRFDVALVADTQPQTGPELMFLRDTVLASIASGGAAFAINHGDVVFDAPDLYARYIQLTSAAAMPWHHCPGNHDLDPVTDAGECLRTWHANFGPSYYAFQHGGVTFLILNNVQRISNGRYIGYRGCLGPDQLAFVRNVLAHVPPDALVVTSMHIPLVGLEDPFDPAGHTCDMSDLMQLLSGRASTVSFAGHTHTTEHHYLGLPHGFAGPGLHHHHVLTTACGSWWSGPYDACGLPVSDSRDGTPKGYHVLSIDGSRYTTRFVATPALHSPHIRLSIDCAGDDDADRSDHRLTGVQARSLLLDQTRSARIVVNVFDGGPRTKVSFLMANHRGVVSGPVTMAPRAGPDPFTVMSFCRHREDLKSWVAPASSSHLWDAPFPPDLAVGSYRLIVRWIDEYGRHFEDASIIELFS